VWNSSILHILVVKNDRLGVRYMDMGGRSNIEVVILIWGNKIVEMAERGVLKRQNSFPFGTTGNTGQY